MKVSLISYTQPSPLLLSRFREELGDKEFELKSIVDLVAYCARVSNPANQYNTMTANKLIKYLIKNRHWSPLEMVDITLEIETTRDISRQHLRHRSFSFQEFSQRYAEALGFEISECRIQDPKHRQNSIPCTDYANNAWWEAVQNNAIMFAEKYYKDALERGIAKEVARKILPEGLTLTRLYAKNSLRGWIHYLQVRGEEKSGTQKEHLLLARECAKVITEMCKGFEEIWKS